MARPVIPVTRIFASDVNYTNGPAILIGTATKIARSNAEIDEGWLGDETPPAQEYNDLWNGYTTWTKWLGEGSLLPDLDDHIIETNTDGTAQIAEVLVGGTARVSPLAALVITGNASGDGILTTTGTPRALQAQNASATNPAILGENSGTDNAIHGRTTGGGTGIFGQAITLAGIGVEGQGFLTGNGVEGTGGATGKGVLGIGGATSGVGVEGQSASTSAAVLGASTNTNGVGVQGTTPAAAAVTAAAVKATTGTGDGIALSARAEAGDGHAAQLFSKVAAPVRSALRLVPQDANPTTAADGDIYVKSDTTDIRALLKFRGSLAWQTALTNLKGFAWAPLAFQAGTVSNNNNAVYTNGVLAQLPASGVNSPNETGVVWIFVSAGVANTAGTANVIDLRIRDDTAGVNILDEQMDLVNVAVTGSESTYMRLIPYTLPSVGATRDFRLQFKINAGAGTGVDLNNASLLILGVF